MAFRKIKGSFKNKDISTHVIEDTYLAHDTATGQLRIGDGVTAGGTLVTTGSSLTIQEEGSSLSTDAETLNFVGSAVTATGDGATKTITISSLTVQEEGSTLSTEATTLNFVGSNVTASGTGGTKTITISPLSLIVQEEGSSLSTAATTLNFVGSSVTATGDGATKTITVSGGDTSSGFPNSTSTSFPLTTDSSATDFQEGSDGIGTSGAVDAFGVSIISLFDCMEPIGSLASTNFGDDESHVGG